MVWRPNNNWSYLLGGWFFWTNQSGELPIKSGLKTCSTNSDCILVETIEGLDYIPTVKEEGGCLCVTSISNKFQDLWNQKKEEFRGKLKRVICKPCAYTMENSQAECEKNQCLVKSKGKVTITTDKTEYEQGESVKIAVRNGLKQQVFGYFDSCGNRPFWGLQRFENGRWEEFNFSFPNLTKEACDFILCEKTEPVELRAGLETEDSWPLTNICEWPLEPIGVPKTEPKPINNGTYRVFLIYGLNTDGFNLIGPETIHSNEFTIKEKKNKYKNK